VKKLTLDEWEKKYIAGPVERFDQKYIMFIRPFWDMELRERLQDWSFFGEIKDKPGFTLQDQALRFASWRGDMLSLLNTSKPNPMPAAQAIMEVLAATGPATPVMAYQLPEGARIDTSDPQRVTRDVKKVATYFGADLVGICQLDRRWVYSHTLSDFAKAVGGGFNQAPESTPQEIPEEFQYAIVMAFEEDYDMLRYFPTYLFLAETYWGYSRMAFTSLLLSAFIRNLGFKAIDSTTNDVCLFMPLAMQAGLGELGRNGLLITPQFGPRVRLAVIITDLPLVADSPIEFGVAEFCTVCKKCAKLCPSRSILSGERTGEPRNVSNIAGTLKWPVNTETCRMYWSQSGTDCGICMSVCPYNKASTWPHRTTRWFADHVRWADAFYLKMDDFLGYGKPRKADNFWEEWQP